MAVDMKEEKKCEAIFTFLKDTKEGKYSKIDLNIIEMPRIMTSRSDYLFEEEIPVMYSVTNQL